LMRVAGYEILEEIARGGMGIVYRARQLDPRRTVALKMLLARQAASPDMGERFRLEVRALTELDHPAILPVHQTGEHDGLPFFTMKLATGGSLAEHKEEFAGNWRRIAELMATLADAVQFAHERGILHRDLKPGNILFDNQDRPYVSDFGLAKLVSDDSNLTRSVDFLGTPHYVAPEVALRSARAATIASDLYSLGAILYELMAGRPPFEAEGIAALLKKIVEEEPVKPSAARAEMGHTKAEIRNPKVEANPKSEIRKENEADASRRSSVFEVSSAFGFRPSDFSVPRDLEVICLKCLAKEPARRYDSARALAEDLRRWLEHREILARPAGLGERAWLWARRHRATAAALGFALVLLLALVAGITVSALQIAASRREALRTIEALEAQKANELLAGGSTAEGIALLARRVRGNPQNWADTARLMWALQRRRWAVPVLSPYGPAVPGTSALIEGPDQRLLAVFVSTNLVVRDVAGGTNRHEWPVPFTPGAVVIKESGLVEFTDPDHRRWSFDSFSGRMSKLSATTPAELDASNLSVTRHGQLAFVVASDHSGRLLDLQTGSVKMLVPVPPGSAEASVSHYPVAVFFPDGRRLAFSDRERTIHLVDCASGEVRGPAFTASHRVLALRISPDGRVLVTLTVDSLQFWDVASGKELPARPEVGVNFKFGAFLRDSSRYIQAGNPFGLVLFDPLKGQISKLPARGVLLSGQCHSDQRGRFVYVSFEQCLAIFEAETGQPLCEPLAHEQVQKGILRFVQDRFATLGPDGLTVLWEVKTNRARQIVLRHTAALQAARFSPDGRRVVTASHDGTARVWDSHTGEPVGAPMVHGDKVWSACFSPDGRRVATGSWDSTARLWDAASGAPLSPPLRASNYVFHVEFSPDGSRLLACGEDRFVRLYDGGSGQAVLELPPQPSAVYWAHFSPDGRTIVTRPWNANPKLWSAGTGEMLCELNEPSPRRAVAGIVTQGDFSKDGHWLALGSPGHFATIWRLPEGRLHAVLNHAAIVRTALLDKDARIVLTTADDLTARLWDLELGTAASPPLASPSRSDSRVHTGHALRANAIHPDGRRAVTGGSDAAARLWDLRNGLSLGEPAEFDGSVMDAAFSPDGQSLLLACFDGTAHLLSLPPLIERAPDWLAPLAEALAGQRYDAQGGWENVSPRALWEVCEKVRHAPLSDPGIRWARDLLDF
jgi:WD40 repeat protein